LAQFGVHFDRRARASAPIPERIREQAMRLMQGG
jgi:hypothetical protein